MGWQGISEISAVDNRLFGCGYKREVIFLHAKPPVNVKFSHKNGCVIVCSTLERVLCLPLARPPKPFVRAC